MVWGLSVTLVVISSWCPWYTMFPKQPCVPELSGLFTSVSCCSSYKNINCFVSITHTLSLLLFLSHTHSVMLSLSLVVFLSVSHAPTWLLYISHLTFAHIFTLLSFPSLPFSPKGDFQGLSSSSSGKERNKPKEPSSHPWPLVPSSLPHLHFLRLFPHSAYRS